MNRRWFLKALLALPFVPLATQLEATTELVFTDAEARLELVEQAVTERISRGLYTNDIIATTIESRSRQIADNVYKNNALLLALRRHDARMKSDPVYRRGYNRQQWRGVRYKYSRGETVRVDARCPSGFAAWRDTWAS